MFSLDRATNKRTLTFTLEVDEDCFIQALFTYAKQNHIDPTNQTEWEHALKAVSSFERWREHPHARIVLEEGELPTQTVDPTVQPTVQPKTRKSKPATRKWSLTEEEKDAFRALALDTPMSEWGSLKEKIPGGLPTAQKKNIYQIRKEQEAILKELRAERAPGPLEQFGAIGEALSTNGIH